MNDIDDKIERYARGECRGNEAVEVREYLVAHPHMIITLLSRMRRNAMDALGIAGEPVTPSGTFANIVADPSAGLRSIYEFLGKMLKGVKKNDADVTNEEVERRAGERTKNTNNMNTTNLTPEQLQAAGQAAAEMLNTIDSSRSTLSNMVTKLLAARPQLSAEGATAVCRSLIAGITNFDSTYSSLCKANADDNASVDTIYDKCLAAVADLSPEQQAMTILSFIALAKSIDAQNIRAALTGEEAKSFGQILDNGTQMPAEINDDTLAQLKDQLRQTLADSSICLLGINDEEQFLAAALATDDTLAKTLEEHHLADADFKAYAALAAYLATTTDNPDVEVEPEALGAAVAAGIEREKVMAGAAKGLISWENAAKLLKWIGTALLFALFAWIAINLGLLILTGVTVITVALIGNSFFTLLAGLAAGFYLACRGTQWFSEKVMDPAIEAARNAYDKVVDFFRNAHLIERAKEAYRRFSAWLAETWTALVTRLVPSTPRATDTLTANQ